ncbi:MAG: hypothetical protein WBB07_15660 [Mycobacterium sp.]
MTELATRPGVAPVVQDDPGQTAPVPAATSAPVPEPAPAQESTKVPRHYPPRRAMFLEKAAMAREMYRL